MATASATLSQIVITYATWATENTRAPVWVVSHIWVTVAARPLMVRPLGKGKLLHREASIHRNSQLAQRCEPF